MLSGVDDRAYIDPRAGEVRDSELALTWLKGHEHKNPRTYRRHKERVQLHIIPTAVGKMRVKDVKPSSLLNWLHAVRSASRGPPDTRTGRLVQHLRKMIFRRFI